MKVLVIGGAGYIGSHVAKALLEDGASVTVYDDLSSGHKINLFAKAGFVEGSILDYAKLEQTMGQGFDAVVHLAAKKAVGESMVNPGLYAENNLNGAVNILNAMAKTGVKVLVFSSSAAVYGMPEYLPVDEKHPLNPISFYGFTKQETERLMVWYDRLKGIRYTALRYFNAAGYDASGAVKGRDSNPQNLLPIIKEVVDGKRECLQVFGDDYDTRDGTCVRDYVHVSDLAAAHVLANKTAAGRPAFGNIQSGYFARRDGKRSNCRDREGDRKTAAGAFCRTPARRSGGAGGRKQPGGSRTRMETPLYPD